VSQLIEKSGHEPSRPLSAQLTYLRHRSRALDVAVVLGPLLEWQRARRR
jgi:hypothetical protein